MNTLILIPLLGLLLLYLGVYKANKALLPVAVVGLLGALGTTVSYWCCNEGVTFSGMLQFDHVAIVFSSLSIVATAIILLLTTGYAEWAKEHFAEYYALLLFALTGAIMVMSYHNLSMLFIGIETMSICLYILAGINKKDAFSNEAALKYFLMGSFSTGILLMGIALIYGATASFDLSGIAEYMQANQGHQSRLLYVGLIFLLTAFAFKVGAAPFHFWTPDVYQGAPTFVTSFMSTVVKVSVVVAFLKLFSVCFVALSAFWSPILFIIIALTLFVGNITAVLQTNFKRMLAYSSISHAGYMLLAVFVLGSAANASVLVYASGYTVASIVAFAGLIVVKRQFGSSDFESFNGLAKKNPFLALAITVAMMSFAGIPLTAGFVGKFAMFNLALEHYHVWIVALAVINAVIAIFYYFKVIVAMYFREAREEQKISVSFGYNVVIALCLIITLAIGLCPNFLLNLV